MKFKTLLISFLLTLFMSTSASADLVDQAIECQLDSIEFGILILQIQAWCQNIQSEEQWLACQAASYRLSELQWQMQINWCWGGQGFTIADKPGHKNV